MAIAHPAMLVSATQGHGHAIPINTANLISYILIDETIDGGSVLYYPCATKFPRIFLLKGSVQYSHAIFKIHSLYFIACVAFSTHSLPDMDFLGRLDSLAGSRHP